MGKRLLGRMRVAMIFRGEYDPGADPAVSYTPLDIVLYQGAGYLNRAACSGVTPGSDTSKWIKVWQDGAHGADGPDGASAYEIWLANGGVGSVADFLNSLIGADGADGPAGADGAPGAAGADGKSVISVAFVGDNMVFTLSDSSTVILAGAKTALKGSDATVTKAAVEGVLIGNITTHNHALAHLGAAAASHFHNMNDVNSGNLDTQRLSETPYVTGGISMTAKALFDVVRGDRTAFLPESQIIIEKSTDAGATWADAGVSDSVKRRLFTGQRPSIAIPLKNGVKSTDCMIRITITGMRYNVPAGTPETEKYAFWNPTYAASTERYFVANDGWSWVSSGDDRMYCKVERASCASPNAWILDREAYLSGWTGGSYFQLSGNTFGGYIGQTDRFWNWRFTFRTCSKLNTFVDADLSVIDATGEQVVYHLKVTGPNVWVYSNNYMYHEHLYSWDEYKNVTFPAGLVASGFSGPLAGNADTASKLFTPRSITIGGKALSFDGSGAIAYTLAEIGAAAASHTHTPEDAGAAPASHDHDAGNVTSGTLGVPRGGTGKSSVTAGSYLKGDGANALVERTPAQVLSDIGAAASGHNHDSTYLKLTGGTVSGSVTATSFIGKLNTSNHGTGEPSGGSANDVYYRHA